MHGAAIRGRMPLVFLEDRHSVWHAYGEHQQQEPVAFARGHATSGGNSLEGRQLARHVHQIAMRGPQALQAEVPNLNGGWAIVVQWPTGEVLAAVDRLRTIPLFFYHDDNCFAIAANGTQLAHRFSRSMNTRAQLEFLLFRYVTGSETLYDGVQQLQSGEMILYRPSEDVPCSTTRYFRYYPSTIATGGLGDLADGLAATIQRVFERFRDGFHGNRVMVPLSGGLDSRLVAAMLKRVGIDQCLCFSYGDERGEEARISRQVAEALGYEWRFVPYSSEVWARWNRSPTLREYFRYACRGVSCPLLQDFPAVMQFAEDGLADDQTLFFPGHTGDMISGWHIPTDYPDILAGKVTPAAHIIRSHGRALWDNPGILLDAPAAEGLREKIRTMAAPPPGATGEYEVGCCDMWNAEQRQAKFIINSVRTYEFVGSGWRTLWDYELMDFFLRVPIEFRYGQRLYLNCLRDRVFVDELAPLARIPLAKHGPLMSRSMLRSPARPAPPIARWTDALKTRARLQLLKFGLSRRRLAKVDSSQVTRVRLSGLGIPDEPVVFQEALDRIGALPWLEPDVQKALRPWLSYNLDSLRFLSVLATIVLAEMTKDISEQKNTADNNT